MEDEGGGERDAVDDAFTFVLPSIERALQRLEAIDARIQHVTTAIATVTFAAPVAGRAIHPTICFNPLDCWQAIPFVVGLSLGIVSIGAGHWFKSRGSMRMLRIKTMHERHLDKTSPAFRKHIIGLAGHAEDTNLKRLDKRGRTATALSVVLVAEALLLAVWIAVGG